MTDIKTILESISTITVYHGGDHPEPHDNMYFSTDLRFATEYGKVFQYKINLGKMFDSLEEESVSDFLPMYDPYTESDVETISDYMDRSSDTWELIEQHLSDIEAMGYDSVRVFEGGIENFLVFDKSNIEIIE
jgi:hypothetical protein